MHCVYLVCAIGISSCQFASASSEYVCILTHEFLRQWIPSLRPLKQHEQWFRRIKVCILYLLPAVPVLLNPEYAITMKTICWQTQRPTWAPTTSCATWSVHTNTDGVFCWLDAMIPLPRIFLVFTIFFIFISSLLLLCVRICYHVIPDNASFPPVVDVVFFVLF